MSQIWKKMKKSEMRKTFSGEKVFHFMLKSNCPKLRKTGTKSISKRCFRVAFFTYPHTWISRETPPIWEERLMRVEKLNHSPREKIGEKV